MFEMVQRGRVRFEAVIPRRITTDRPFKPTSFIAYGSGVAQHCTKLDID